MPASVLEMLASVLRCHRRCAMLAAIVVLIAVSGLVAAPAYAQSTERVTEKSFPAVDDGTLTIDAKDGGILDISSWESPVVHVLVMDRKRNYKVAFEPGDKELTVRGSYDGPEAKGVPVDVLFRVEVPRRFNLVLSTENGQITITALDGTVLGRTMRGNISLSKVVGSVDLKTTAGNIMVLASRVTGTLRADRGNINVPVAPAGIDVETMAGNIVIGSAAGTIRAFTGAGNITIGPVGGTLQCEAKTGDVEALLGSRAGDCDVSTDAGSITLRLLASYSGAFEVMSKGVPGDRGVECETVGLVLRGQGPYAGTLGTGEHKVHLRAPQGRVRILKGK